MSARLPQTEAVLDAWARGEEQRPIAAALGLSEGQVNGIVKNARRRGDPRAEPRVGAAQAALTDAQVSQLLLWKRSGNSADRIATWLGVTRETVLNHARKHGAPFRSATSDTRNMQNRAPAMRGAY